MICGNGGGVNGSGSGTISTSGSRGTSNSNISGTNAIGLTVANATGGTTLGPHRRILRGHAAQTTNGERVLLINYVSPNASAATSPTSTSNTVAAVNPTTSRKILHSRATNVSGMHSATPVSFAGLGSEVTVTLTRSGKPPAGHIVRNQSVTGTEIIETPAVHTASSSPPPLVFSHSHALHHDPLELQESDLHQQHDYQHQEQQQQQHQHQEHQQIVIHQTQHESELIEFQDTDVTEHHLQQLHEQQECVGGEQQVEEVYLN
ncbi:probable nuclear hormone receptor HR38 [Teleopsis dalmanni]|uniref:probable nuclear hormone receptor HR38 n=1 Tax=Teleopsis dalmanni TaxID=139649 RepID=UPI0018CD008F|nr:probable nuclear hormone receptor HR38 [Teleopsis dalmanni]